MNADDEHPLSGDEVAVAVEVLRLLADATRLRLLWVLRGGEASVNVLADKVGASASSVSQHLAKLRLAGVVASRRDGARVYYRLRSEHVSQLVLDAVHHAEHTGDDPPRHHRRSADVTELTGAHETVTGA